MEDLKLILPNAVILPDINPGTLTFGSLDPYPAKEIFPNSDCSAFLPAFETQANTYFDTYACVSHSFENAVETLIKATLSRDKWLLENIYRNGGPDFSDRDLAILSGTIPGIGNSGEKVLHTAQTRGLIPQTAGDWDTSSRDTKMVQELYYAYSRTKDGEILAKSFNERYKITGIWVHKNNWEEAMKEGTLQVYVKAWSKNSEGKYYNPTPGFYNHAVVAVSYKDISILDTYQPAIKQLTSWDDAHIWALKINITKIMPIKVKMENNTLVQLVEGVGGFGLYLDDKIFVDSLDKILASWLVRNNGKLDGKTRALTLSDWNAFSKVNLKGETV